jgi:hypothetical protein
MKAAGIVILLPLLSVVILSLYMAGGAARVAAVALLTVGGLGALVLHALKRKAATHH